MKHKLLLRLYLLHNF